MIKFMRMHVVVVHLLASAIATAPILVSSAVGNTTLAFLKYWYKLMLVDSTDNRASIRPASNVPRVAHADN